MLKTREVAFLACAAGAAALFVRLGVWQLQRLGERRARNALIEARVEMPVADLSALGHDTVTAQFRRVRLEGQYDYAHEVALTNRIRDGAPGVALITPLRRPGNDTAVLVERGWVYSPDATSIDFLKWRERDTVAGVGRVQELLHHPESPGLAGYPNEFRWVSPDSISRAAGYPIAPYLVVLEGDSAAPADPHQPVRVDVPPLDDGPHLNYAIQWFAFALIAIGGSSVAVFHRPARPIDYEDTGRTA